MTETWRFDNGLGTVYYQTKWTSDSGDYDIFHREDGPALETEEGHKEWWYYGLRHRENGPAIERVDGGKEWFWNGDRHREDGPAVIMEFGREEWWLWGEQVFTDADFYRVRYEHSWRTSGNLAALEADEVDWLREGF